MQRLGVDHIDDRTRSVINDIVATAHERQQYFQERGRELDRGLAIEI